MKPLLTLLLVTSCAAMANPALPEFSAKLDPAPGLSLTEDIKVGQLKPIPQAVSVYRRPAQARKLISRMSVVEPAGSVDRNMPVVEPKPGIDYRMIVEEPEVVSEK